MSQGSEYLVQTMQERMTWHRQYMVLLNRWVREQIRKNNVLITQLYQSMLCVLLMGECFPDWEQPEVHSVQTACPLLLCDKPGWIYQLESSWIKITLWVDPLKAEISFYRIGKVIQTLNNHQHFVQGVTWDPAGKFIASTSSDRTCRIYAHQPTPKKSTIRKKTVVESMFTCRQVLAKAEVEASKTTTTTETSGKTSKVSFCSSNI